jgi:hypothetical protein
MWKKKIDVCQKFKESQYDWSLEGKVENTVRESYIKGRACAL